MTDAGLLASVVVAVHADARVRRLVGSLASQSLPPAAYEVIVVENGSVDLADVDGAYGITRYVHLARASTAGARNAGLCLARGRFLLLTDADCVARPDWIEKMTAALACGALAAVGGLIVKHRPRTWPQRHAITVADGCKFCYDEHIPTADKAWLAAGDAIHALEKFRFFYQNESVDFMGGEPFPTRIATLCLGSVNADLSSTAAVRWLRATAG